MEYKFQFTLILGLSSLLCLTVLLILCWFCFRRRKLGRGSRDVEESDVEGESCENSGDLIKFEGGENLSVGEILDAPGEVIGKCSYGTLYRACLVDSNSIALLRFVRPSCSFSVKEVMPVVEFLGGVRHPNLVPLTGFYAGTRGEKLMVHPFYGAGNLAEFIRDGNGEAHKWPIMQRISIGIARGIHHLHTAFDHPIIHGNLKSKNILLDSHFNSYVSDFGLHLLLTPTAGQQMLEVLASEGYKSPELIKMKDISEDSDVYSFGVILLELLIGKEPMDYSSGQGEDFYLLDMASSAILDDRIVGLFHPGILLGLSGDGRTVVQECLLNCFQLAMACCTATRILRPNMSQVVDRLEEIGK